MFRLCIHTCNLFGGASLLYPTNSIHTPDLPISIYRRIGDGDSDKPPRYESSNLRQSTAVGSCLLPTYT